MMITTQHYTNAFTKKRTWIARITAVAVGIALATGAAVSQDSKTAPDKTQTTDGAKAAVKPALTVTAGKPLVRSVPSTLTANGNIAAWQEAIIGSLANGLQLTDVRVNVGDVVRKGQVLAVFGAETVRAELAQTQAGVAEAEAALAAAIADNERAKTLKDSGALSVQQIAQYDTQAKTAAARLQAAKAQVQAAQVRLKQTTVYSTDDGVISARMATVGAVVAGGQELFRMIRQSRLEWRAEVVANQIGNVKVGSTATVVAANGTSLQGKVRMIAPTVDPQTRTSIVYVDLPKAANVSAGMFAKGEFDFGATDVVTVMQQSVVVRDGFNYVFVLGSPDAVAPVSQTKITIGRRIGDRIEVTDGLKPINSVVENGAGFLADGDTVKVVAQADTKPATKATSPTTPRAK